MKYIKEGHGKNVILLHGWGCNKRIFTDVIKNLKDSYTFYSLDLPGFGETYLDFALTIDEYGELLNRFIEKNNIETPTIVGHSFGGRVAINYASKYYCEKLVLVDSAGIKRFNPKVYAYKSKRNLYKFLRMNKRIEKLREKYSSVDYKNANPLLKETLKNAVNYDQRHELKLVSAETLLIWGENDTDTPLRDGYLMKKLINDSEIIVMKDVGHYPFLEDNKKFNLILDAFLRGN